MSGFQKIPEEILEEIKNKSDIVEVVEQYVTLSKKSGSNYFGLCPFHGEDTPSFSVAPGKQIFYCFGCHKGGDVIHFIREIEKISYIEAVRLLAARAHVHIPENEDPEQQKRDRLRERVIAANTEAARHFYRNLSSPAGALAVDYLRRRGIDGQTAQRFGLGYAVDAWQYLYDHLRQSGFRPEELAQTGLFKQNRNGGWYDLFRGRLMFPIIDTMGRVIAFGGRILGDEGPKYLNSPETIVYTKGQTLYAMNLAKQTRENSFVLVEGYMDVIAMHQAGIDHAVGVLGTALTEQQLKLLRRYSNELILCFDADRAGQNAAMRSFDLLRGRDFQVKVLVVPDGKDPDEYIRTKGADRFRAILKDALPWLTYLLKRAEVQTAYNGTVDQVRLMEALYPVMDMIDSEVQLKLFAAQVAEVAARMTPDEVIKDYERYRRGQRAAGNRRQRTLDTAEMVRLHPETGADLSVGPAEPMATRLNAAELALLVLLTRNPSIAAQLDFVPSAVEFTDFKDSGFAAQALKLLACGQMDQTRMLELAGRYQCENTNLRDRFSEQLYALPEAYHEADMVRDGNRIAARIRLDYLRGQRNAVSHRIDDPDLDKQSRAALTQDRERYTEQIMNLRRLHRL